MREKLATTCVLSFPSRHLSRVFSTLEKTIDCTFIGRAFAPILIEKKEGSERSVHLTKSWQGDRIAISKRKKGKERKERRGGKVRVRDSAWPLKMSARNVAATPFPWNRNMTVRFLRHVCRLSSRFLVNTLHLLIYVVSDNAAYDPRVPINFLMQISRSPLIDRATLSNFRRRAESSSEIRATRVRN